MNNSINRLNRFYRFSFESLRKMSNVVDTKPIECSIRQKLETNLAPAYMDVINESYMHNVPKGAETHFKVIVVSEKFNDQPLIKRHQLINGLLQVELENGVHALSIVAKTPAQWKEGKREVSPSPSCRGGFGK